jgi:hypothetical protein
MDDGRECAGNYPTQCLWNDTRGSTEGSLREGSEESQVHTNRRRSGSLVHGELVEVGGVANRNKANTHLTTGRCGGRRKSTGEKLSG